LIRNTQREKKSYTIRTNRHWKIKSVRQVCHVRIYQQQLDTFVVLNTVAIAGKIVFPTIVQNLDGNLGSTRVDRKLIEMRNSR